MQEIVKTYDNLLTNEPELRLSQASIRFADYSSWQRQVLQGSKLNRLQSFWRNKLREAPSNIEFINENRNRAKVSYKGAERSFEISGLALQQIKHLNIQEGYSTLIITLAAFNLLLFYYSHQNDICIRIPIANRTRSEIKNEVGFFANAIVFRNTIEKNITVATFLQKVKKSLYKCFRYKEYPLKKIIECYQYSVSQLDEVQ